MRPEPDRDCLKVFELLSQYLDRELPEMDCNEVRRHVQDCPPCIEFLDSLEESIRLCRDYRPPEEPSPLDDAQKDELAEAFRRAVEARRH